MTREEWNALAERCEKAAGPDRDIDGQIVAAVFGVSIISDATNHFGLGPYATWGGEHGPRSVPTYTRSLDAITALIEVEFPGWDVDWHSHDGEMVSYPVSIGSRKVPDDGKHPGWCDARLAYHHPNMDPQIIAETDAKTEPLARCAALCRAKAWACDA